MRNKVRIPQSVKSFANIVTLGSLFSLAANSADLPQTIPTKHFIKDAIQLKMTPRGMSLFKDNIDLIFAGVGISIDEYYTEQIKWDSQTQYKISELSSDPKTKKLIKSTQNLLSDWFAGLRVEELKPSVQVDGFDIKTDFNSFSITTDEVLLKSLNKADGIVLILEADMKFIEADLDKVSFKNNVGPDLGTTAIKDLKIKIAGGAKSYKVRMPFYVRVTEANGLEFKALDFSQNLLNTDISITHSKIVTPSVQLVINGKAYDLDDKQVEKQFNKSLPDIITSLRKMIHSLAREQVPGLLNDLAKKYLIGALEQEDEIPVVNDNDLEKTRRGTKSRVPLKFGLHLNNVSQINSVNFFIDSYIDDPKNPNSVSPQRLLENRIKPIMNTLPEEQYDFAISVDQTLLDRALQLSFERGLFREVGGSNDSATPEVSTVGWTQSCINLKNKIDTSAAKEKRELHEHGENPANQPKSYISMRSAPTVTNLDWSKMPAPQRGETFTKLKLDFTVSPGTVKSMIQKTLIIDDGFEVSVDLVVKINKSADSQFLEVYLWDIDDSSLSINKHNLSFLANHSGLIQNLIKKTILGTFHDKIEMQKCLKTPLADKIPLPSLPGVGTAVEHLTMESTGNLVLYLNYVYPNQRGAK